MTASRRRAASRAMLVFVLVLVGYLALVLGWAWLTVHPVGLPLRRHPRDFGLPWTDISFPATDGVNLKGWRIPADHATGIVVLCHGYPGNRGEFLGVAPCLHRAGFHVVAFDFRGLGESGRARSTLGKDEVNDLLGAVTYIRQEAWGRGLPLGVLGFSMGGAAAIRAAARSSEIVAVVSDSAYANLARPVRQRLRFLFGRSGPIVLAPGVWFLTRLLGCPLETVSPEQDIPRLSPRPVLIIHGADDRLVLPEDAHRLFAAAGQPKDLWIVPSARHVRAFSTAPEEYEQRITRFFRAAFAHEKTET